MWIKNSNTNEWERDSEKLNKDVYNLMRQELDKVRFYAKCLDGTSYLPINNLDNIYDKLQYTTTESWYLGSTTYSVPVTGDIEITRASQESYSEYVLEGGMTIKNLFTDEKVINDSVDNYIEVDLISTEEIENLTSEKKGLFIDGIRVKEGHRVLIKNQQSFVTLASSIDPDVFFDGNYYIIDEDLTTVDYFFYNETNGIYVYTNNTLVKNEELNVYETNMRYSVVSKLGNENFDRQFHLSRLKDGFYPLTSKNEPIEFLEKHNWILRNQLDYQNVLEVNYNDVLKHGTSIVGSYSIPERTISVGNFGTIINNQNGISSVIKSKFKADLKGVDETDGYYWACGSEGTLLKINKIDFSIESIKLDTFQTLNSVSFFNNSRGVVVGKFNTIYYTFNGGVSWKKIEIEGFEDLIFNNALYYSLETFYVVGNNGLFLEFIFNNGQWTVNKRNPLKKVDANEEFFVVENIREITQTDFSSWNLGYNFATASTVNTNKKALLMVGDNNTLFLYDVNNFIPDEEYVFISFDNNTIQNDLGDLKTATKRNNDIYLYSEDREEGYRFDINSFTGIGEFSNVLEASSSLVFTEPNLNGDYNKFNDYNNTELIIAGDNSTLKGYTSSVPVYDLDPTFGANFNSKMLFMDYDIASKLNFFDNDSEYRLPSEFSVVNSPTLSTTLLSINSIPGEVSWIDYMKDENKTFQYNTALTTANQVLISTTFSSFATGGSFSNSIIINGGSEVTSNLNLISNLAPGFIGSTASISAPTSSFGLYVYNNLMIVKTDTSITPAGLGEVFNMQSDIIDGNFVLNRIEDFGSDRYLYFYSHFNQNITNELDIISGTISFINLNRFEDSNENMLSSQFNKHPISVGYESTFNENFNINSDSFNINSRFNEKTAYYNLQSRVKFQGAVNLTDDMEYSSAFLDFGFSPTYNLEDYLSNVNPVAFTPGKIFGAMPVYVGVPSNNSGVGMSDNKLVFNPGYKFEYDTFWENTFIDIVAYGTSTETTEKLLILKKYYDSTIDRYVIELSKEINEPTTATFIDIKSRRTLSEISSDLRELNNIHKGVREVSFGSNLFYNLENELNLKFSTENYTKIFLSDADVKANLSAIVYIDNSNRLAMNIIDLGEEVEVEIKNIKNSFGNVEFWTKTPHRLSVGDYVFIDDLDKIYAGVHIVKTIINSDKFISESTWIGASTVSGTIKHFIFDEYLNYEPTDIIDVGIDKKGKIAVDIQPENIKENDDGTIGLINLDLKKFKFKLIDNLSIVDISENYKWILEAELENALIGQDANGNIQWYSGIWHCGRWFGGKWYSGTWRSGQWYEGDWYSVEVKSNPIQATPNLKASDKKFSTWFDGDWRGGTWYNGTHHGGEWFDGEWKDGHWTNGQFHQGTWFNGEFSGGTWILGIWESGILNCNSDLSTWVDGVWNSGDFECGIWKDGSFNQVSGKLSRFGTKSTNSRKSIWESGTWFMGEFHSLLNIDDDDNTTDSEVHKLSVWETGTWNNGFWYGGTAFNINWNSGTWFDGVVREIFVVGALNLGNVPLPEEGKESTILLRGIWNFNRNEPIWIIDNQVGIEPLLGSNDAPQKYLVKGINQIEATTPSEQDLTEVYVYKDTSAVTGFGYTYSVAPGNTGWLVDPIVNSNHSLVSFFQKTSWESGLWENGIFDGDTFKSGMWVNGVFLNGNWS